MRVAAASVAALLLVAGCDPEGGTDMTSGSSSRLEQQRTDVRALTRDLVTRTLATVDGSVRTADAHWEGCRSAFNETYASYRYSAQVRLDALADPLADGLLSALAVVVSDAGLSPGADSEPSKLRATADEWGGLAVSFWQLPAGSQGALLLTVQGPCVDVPEDQRDAWLDRQEDEPDPLA